MRQSAIAITVAVAVLLTSGAATARDTKMSKMYRIDEAVVKAVEKKKFITTKQFRDHFGGWTNDKVKRWAKARKLDQRAFLLLSFQVQIIGLKSISPKHAYLIVNRCNVHGIGPLRTVEGGWMTQCVNEKSTEGAVLVKPVERARVDKWMIEAKSFSFETTTKVTWARTLRIQLFHQPAMVVQKAMLKAGYKTNLDIFDALHMPNKRERFAKRKRIALDQVKRYAAVADLLRIAKITPRLAELMWQSGYRSAVDLKGLPTATLMHKLKETNDRARVMATLPTSDELKVIIAAAAPMKAHN